ncbi:DUF6473 family protein [Roseobacter weihaiensis]|uniref:DUF6473 family protein n=1 Tax=Roseobacter weihaiensis TaxID=2763262 RepID=UPI001D0AD2D0|nr:DUF6473 family protein [Roseobacter sp. H9]
MAYDVLGAKALNYAPCRYGNSRILFRGPQRRLDAPYVAFIGGTETYGKFIKAPFPDLVESDLGVNCINFGVSNAGVDVFLNDGFITEAANGAEATVLQVVGAHNLSNRFYSVHPRRNDRFLTASPLLKSIYPEVDFAEFHFNRHMLCALYDASTERFGIIAKELQAAWSARMKLLLRRICGHVILLWFADHPPSEADVRYDNPTGSSEPLFVTRAMLDDLAVRVSGYVEVTASEEALAAGTHGMVFDELETPAAGKLMGPRAHGETALHLGKTLHSIVRV